MYVDVVVSFFFVFSPLLSAYTKRAMKREHIKASQAEIVGFFFKRKSVDAYPVIKCIRCNGKDTRLYRRVHINICIYILIYLLLSNTVHGPNLFYFSLLTHSKLQSFGTCLSTFIYGQLYAERYLFFFIQRLFYSLLQRTSLVPWSTWSKRFSYFIFQRIIRFKGTKTGVT